MPPRGGGDWSLVERFRLCKKIHKIHKEYDNNRRKKCIHNIAYHCLGENPNKLGFSYVFPKSTHLLCISWEMYECTYVRIYHISRDSKYV